MTTENKETNIVISEEQGEKYLQFALQASRGLTQTLKTMNLPPAHGICVRLLTAKMIMFELTSGAEAMGEPVIGQLQDLDRKCQRFFDEHVYSKEKVN